MCVIVHINVILCAEASLVYVVFVSRGLSIRLKFPGGARPQISIYKCSCIIECQGHTTMPLFPMTLCSVLSFLEDLL